MLADEEDDWLLCKIVRNVQSGILRKVNDAQLTGVTWMEDENAKGEGWLVWFRSIFVRYTAKGRFFEERLYQTVIVMMVTSCGLTSVTNVNLYNISEAVNDKDLLPIG